MSRDVIPYNHPDISSLSKSLRKSFAHYGSKIKQSEMLNVLSKAIGAQNYQAFRSYQPLLQGDSRFIDLSIAQSSTQEHFVRDAEGNWLDRSKDVVNRVMFSMIVTLDIGPIKARVLVFASADGSFDADYKPDYELIQSRVLSKFGEQIADQTIDLHNQIDLSIDLENRGSTKSLVGSSHLIKVSIPQFAKIHSHCIEINASIDASADCLKYLSSLAKEPESVRSQEKQTIEALEFIAEIVDCSGELHLYAWYREKFSLIKRFFRNCVENKSIDEIEHQLVKTSLYVFSAPRVWRRRPEKQWSQITN